MRTISYLDQNVRNSIINDVKDIARYHSRSYSGKEAGFFGIPRQVLCYVDYLGLVAFGDESSTLRAIKFIKKYFPSHYKDYAEFLYAMWRLGTVHQYEPNSYYASFTNDRAMLVTVSWLSNNSNRRINRKENMKFYSLQHSNRDVRLVINICQLVDDLLVSLDNFMAELRKDKDYREECESRIDDCGNIHEYTQIKSKFLRGAVRKQIKLAWERRSGEIDHLGNVIKRYKQAEIIR